MAPVAFSSSRRLKSRVDPRAGDDLGAVHGPQIVLVKVDELVERVLGDEALRGEQRLELRYALGELGVALARAVAAMIGARRRAVRMVVVVVMLAHTRSPLALSK